MDGLLKAFWPLGSMSGNSAMAIPTYRQGDYDDPIDLQIKSLLYMFRRCNIAESQAFLNDATVGGVGVAGAGGSDKYREHAKLQQRMQRGLGSQTPLASSPNVRSKLGTIDKKLSLADLKSTSSNKLFSSSLQAQAGSPARPSLQSSIPTATNSTDLPGISALDKEKLDVMYSKAEFDKLMKNDEHRVLIDWKKNKFRSMCLLSGKPSQSTALPRFPVKNYSFTVLPARSSEITYITVLSDSNLYFEHYVSKDTRRRLAKDALDFVKKDSPSTAAFTKNDRALVILIYLRRLAVEVQVDRLYKNLYRERIKVENRPKNPLSIPEQAVPKIGMPKPTCLSTPTKPLTVSTSLMNSSKTPKYYMKAKGDNNIPFSHRAGNTPQKSPQPMLAFVSPQQVQTTKPRVTSSSKNEMLSPPRSRSSSPVRAPSRATDSSLSNSGSPGQPLLRKRGSNLSLASSGPVLTSPSRSASASGPSKALAISSIPRTSGRKSSTTSLQSLKLKSGPPSQVSPSESGAPNNLDKIRQEVMTQTRKAVQARLEREKLLIQSERK